MGKISIRVLAVLLTFLLSLFHSLTKGQETRKDVQDTTAYFVPSSGNSSINACSGIIYDSGGPYGDYPINADGSLTIYPGTPGKAVELEFITYDIDYYNYDAVYFYDGPDTSSPLLGSFTKNPGIIYATNPAGVLTVRFISDNYLTGQGFSANIHCSSHVPKPDLVVSKLEVSDNYAGYGTSLDVGITIENSGGNIAGSTMTGVFLSKDLHYDSSDVLLAEVPTPSIIAGGSELIYAYVIIPANTALGKYHLVVVTDLYNQVNERVEKNNYARKNLYVRNPRFDLFIWPDSLRSDTIPTAENISIFWKVDFRGDDDVRAVSGVYFSSDTLIDSTDVLLGYLFEGLEFREGNPPGELGQTLQLPEDTPEGKYYLIYFIKSETGVPETNENNNQAILPIYVVPGLPDLNPFISPDTLSDSNGEIGLLYHMWNFGTRMLAPAYAGFYLSSDPNLSSDDIFLQDQLIPVLEHNELIDEFVMVPLPGNLQNGLYYLIVVADVYNTVSESNELNNMASVPVKIGPLDTDLIIKAEQSYSSRVITVVEDTASSMLSDELPSPEKESAVEGVMNIRSYPNPTDGKFTLSFDTNSPNADAAIAVYNSNGEIIAHQSLILWDGSVMDFDLSGYAKGIYAVKVQANGKIFIHKVLVE